MNGFPSAPVQQAERITIIDAIRGVALLGILMMNIPYFSTPEQYVSNLIPRNELSGPNYYTWWVVEGFFEGTMRGLFSLLFGAGIILLLQRLENKMVQPSAADIYYRRLLYLFLFGLFNAFILLWPGDILYSYAICGLFLFPFRKMKPKHLVLFAALFFMAATSKDTYRYYQAYKTKQEGIAAEKLVAQKKTLSEEQKAAQEKWNGYKERSKVENIHKEAANEVKQIGGQNYFGVMGHIKGISAMLESKVFYHVFFFDVMFFLFLGMALFKWKVLTGQQPLSVYWAILLIGYGAGIPLTIWEHSQLIAARFRSVDMFERMPVTVYQLRRVLLTLGHLSLLVLLYRYKVMPFLFRALSRVGQMAFSNYLMQSIICTLLFYGYGFALYGKLQRYELYYVVGAIWVFQIVFSQVWMRYFRFGPFEWAWRSLTYWQQQPMLRKSKPVFPAPESRSPEGLVIPDAAKIPG